MEKFKYYFLRSLPILFVLAVIVTFAMLFDMQKKVDEMYEYDEENKNSVVNNESTIITDDESNLDSNIINELNTSNEVANVSNVTVIEKNTSMITEEEKEQMNTDNNKEKAVKLVKNKYGENSNVIYFCDSVLSTGEFVVAEKNVSSSSISNYYKVNITTGEVSIMF